VRVTRGPRAPLDDEVAAVKKAIHPDYHPVVYHDGSAGTEFTSRSTQKSNEVRKIDGVDHYVIRVEISSASHPYYTGKQKFVDTAGRIEKFQKKFAGMYGSKATAGPAGAAAAAAAAKKAPAEGAKKAPEAKKPAADAPKK
jgi:large subunit ribosomal protein L31